jgi:hypothetical protein
MVSLKSQQTLQWFEQNFANIAANDGAASMEFDILRHMVEATPSGPLGLFGDVNRHKLAQNLPMPQNRADVYGLTHLIFFAADFGRLPLADVDLNHYRAMLDELLNTWVHDTDLCGELLICSKIIGHESGAVNSARVAFDAAWEALDRNNFAQNYHPILIGGLLYSMSE